MKQIPAPALACVYLPEISNNPYVLNVRHVLKCFIWLKPDRLGKGFWSWPLLWKEKERKQRSVLDNPIYSSVCATIAAPGERWAHLPCEEPAWPCSSVHGGLMSPHRGPPAGPWGLHFVPQTWQPGHRGWLSGFPAADGKGAGIVTVVWSFVCTRVTPEPSTPK